jgi:HK97 family phage major capsid protein
MGAEPGYSDLIAELKSAREHFDVRVGKRLGDVETAVNDIFKRLGRPGADRYDGASDLVRKDAIQMCIDRHSWEHQKHEGRRLEYTPKGEEIDEAMCAQRAWRAILRHGNIQRLDPIEQKALSSFNFNSSGWVVPPQVSSRILSCLTDETDFLSLLGQETISAGSVQFPIDNSELQGTGWACDLDCGGSAATIPPPSMMEIRADEIRATICSTNDLLTDASFNVESWVQRKVARAVRQQIAAALICGDGVGKPTGILNPRSGIPQCETAVSTPPGQFTWQDLGGAAI